jgi:hypothetical protein
MDSISLEAFGISLEALLKILTAIGGFATIGWGIFQFNANQRAQAETRRIEATRPFLDRQLTLYTAATQAAATLASSSDADKLSEAKIRFWSLYWGELALVEDEEVEGSMVELGKKLENGASREVIQQAALKVAHACRNSLATSWNVQQWRSPY